MVIKKEKEMEKEIRETANKFWLAGLGAVSVAEEEGSKLFNTLVDKGSAFEKKSRAQIVKVTDTVTDKVKDAKGVAEDTFDRMGKGLDEQVAETLGRLGVPTRDEIQKLTKRVEQLNRKMDQLKTRPAAKPRTTTAKKTTTAKPVN